MIASGCGAEHEDAAVYTKWKLRESECSEDFESAKHGEICVYVTAEDVFYTSPGK